MNKSKIERGQSLFELVVAIAISALIIVTIVSLVSNSLRNSTFSRNKAEAASFAQEATEWLRTQRDTNTEAFIDNVAIPTWCFKTLSWSISNACLASQQILDAAGLPTPFLREGHFASTLVSGKTVIETDVVVSWTDSQGLHQVTSATNFTDWRQR